MCGNFEPYAYALRIGRYGRYMTFATLDALREETSRYFTSKESHIVDRLCSFNKKPDPESGAIKNEWRDFTTLYYPEDEHGLIE